MFLNQIVRAKESSPYFGLDLIVKAIFEGGEFLLSAKDSGELVFAHIDDLLI